MFGTPCEVCIGISLALKGGVKFIQANFKEKNDLIFRI